MKIGVDLELDRQRFRISSKGDIVLVTEPMLEKLFDQEESAIDATKTDKEE